MYADSTTALWALLVACAGLGLFGLAVLVGRQLRAMNPPEGETDPFVVGQRIEFTGDWCRTQGEHGFSVFTHGQVVEVMGEGEGEGEASVTVRYQSGRYSAGERPAYVTVRLINPRPWEWRVLPAPWEACTDDTCPYAGLPHLHVREGSAP